MMMINNKEKTTRNNNNNVNNNTTITATNSTNNKSPTTIATNINKDSDANTSTMTRTNTAKTTNENDNSNNDINPSENNNQKTNTSTKYNDTSTTTPTINNNEPTRRTPTTTNTDTNTVIGQGIKTRAGHTSTTVHTLVQPPTPTPPTSTNTPPTYAAVLRSTDSMITKLKTRSSHLEDERIAQLNNPPLPPHEDDTTTANDTLPSITSKERWEKICQIPHKPIPSSKKFANGADWSNTDLELFFKTLEKDTGIPFVNPLFLPTATTTPSRAIKWLRQSTTGENLFIPLWVRHHWLLAFLTETSIKFCDSAEGVIKQTEIKDVAAFISQELDGKQRKVVIMSTLQQPPHSNECGLHVALNATLLAQSHLVPKRIAHKTRIISYDSTLTKVVEMYTTNTTSLQALTDNILKQIAITDVPLLTHDDVREKLDELAGRDCNNFKIGWIAYPADAKPTHLEWNGTLLKKERRSWRCSFLENENSAVVPYKEINYLYIIPNLDAHLQDLNHLNGNTPFRSSNLDGDTILFKEVVATFNACPKLTSVPTEMDRTLAKSTKKKHRQMLNDILSIPEIYHHLPCNQAIMRYLTTCRRQRKWTYSTLLAKAASIQGALRLAPIYLENAPSISMKGSLYWSLCMRNLQTQVVTEIPNQARPAVQDQIDKITKEVSPVARVIELSWACAARVGDILQLEPIDLVSTNNNTAMNIRFRRGKTASKNQYIITIPHPSEAMIQWIEEAREKKHTILFPNMDTAKVTKRLRVEHKLLESRSLRRGRLQQLSKAGATDTELLFWSRHTGIPMLRRYLSFGTDSGENKNIVQRTKELMKASKDAENMKEPEEENEEEIEEEEEEEEKEAEEENLELLNLL